MQLILSCRFCSCFYFGLAFAFASGWLPPITTMRLSRKTLLKSSPVSVLYRILGTVCLFTSASMPSRICRRLASVVVSSRLVSQPVANSIACSPSRLPLCGCVCAVLFVVVVLQAVLFCLRTSASKHFARNDWLCFCQSQSKSKAQQSARKRPSCSRKTCSPAACAMWLASLLRSSAPFQLSLSLSLSLFRSNEDSRGLQNKADSFASWLRLRALQLTLKEACSYVPQNV